ncbi:MAG: hypothetical protein GY830_04700 [Bacteroidetes bacterium]|nr:hypothetical protein [Bacteroidota bacterium]
MEEIKYQSVLTCPKCSKTQIEKFSDVDCCHLSFKCRSCGFVMEPKQDGTCALCNYGTVKCPATQKDGNGICKCCKK